MPIGVIVDCAATAVGGLLGAILGKYIPQKIKSFLPVVFSVCCLGIGISLIVQAKSLSAVMLSVILGAVVGAIIDIDNFFKVCVDIAQAKLSGSGKGGDMANAMSGMLSLIVLFCFGTTTILGALTEGLSGDSGILIMKSILDFFTAMIFACTLGYLVSFIALPQFVICIALFFLASLIMPLVSPDMLSDFKACGGLITFATGIRMSGMKDIKSSNMLPALIFALPISFLWSLL